MLSQRGGIGLHNQDLVTGAAWYVARGKVGRWWPGTGFLNRRSCLYVVMARIVRKNRARRRGFLMRRGCRGGTEKHSFRESPSLRKRPAQELLDEVVNVRKALRPKTDRSQSVYASAGAMTNKDANTGSKSEVMASNPQEAAANSSSELSASEKEVLQNKVPNLLQMLDEVDSRYAQYSHQLQIIVLSFDAIAGCGAAKPYIVLALQTISRHFHCMRDAISGQIRATKKSLGEPEDLSGSSSTEGFARVICLYSPCVAV